MTIPTDDPAPRLMLESEERHLIATVRTIVTGAVAEHRQRIADLEERNRRLLMGLEREAGLINDLVTERNAALAGVERLKVTARELGAAEMSSIKRDREEMARRVRSMQVRPPEERIADLEAEVAGLNECISQWQDAVGCLTPKMTRTLWDEREAEVERLKTKIINLRESCKAIGEALGPPWRD